MQSSRRSFLVGSAITAAVSRSAIGANDRIGFALIGAGSRGSHMASVFTDFEDVNLLAVCDVFKPNRDSQATKLGEKTKSSPVAVGDYRRVLDRKDVDALLVTTPDHWHGPIVIEASQAAKDCYVEKPLSNTIEMGQKMRAAVRQYKRVVQVGLQQRSWLHFQENAKRVQDGGDSWPASPMPFVSTSALNVSKPVPVFTPPPCNVSGPTVWYVP